MARKTYNDGFADLVKRLNEMSNVTPEQERQELLEAAKKEPRVLDDRSISLADIAKLAGIKEFKEPTKISPKAEKLIESITGEKSDITRAIEESDKSIAGKIIKEAHIAADELAKEGISCEIIDLRTVRPMDYDAILNSVKKTNRLVVLEEAWPFASVASEITYIVQERAFDYLDAPIQRITTADTPAPYSPTLLKEWLPNSGDVIKAVKKVMYKSN
jgi:deoxyxylulose-5-phosphate synthase